VRRERNQGILCSTLLHAFLFVLLIANLPIFEPTPLPEPEAITVDIVPIREMTNIKPSENTPAPKKEEAKKAEAKKPSPPVKTAENTPPAPPLEEKEKKEKEKQKKAEDKKKEEKKKEKMKEQDLLAVLKSVKEEANKESKKNTKEAETAENTSKSQQYNPDLPLSLSEKDAIKSQISKCWLVPAGAKDAQNLIIALHVSYEKDGSLINVTLADASKSRYDSDAFFRAAADSAMRAVRMCTPLHDLPPEKYETWHDMDMTFDPKEMLF
jgi:outer membrane biosynthesis protein TonB